jgi:four helix bundle protein
MHNFRKLNIWTKSIVFVTNIYRLTKSFPKEEKFGLCSQVERAVVSIPSNIAEGSAKSSNKDFARFLEISLGSSFELESELLIARNLNYLNEENYIQIQRDLIELQKMIVGFKDN